MPTNKSEKKNIQINFEKNSSKKCRKITFLTEISAKNMTLTTELPTTFSILLKMPLTLITPKKRIIKSALSL